MLSAARKLVLKSKAELGQAEVSAPDAEGDLFADCSEVGSPLQQLPGAQLVGRRCCRPVTAAALCRLQKQYHTAVTTSPGAQIWLQAHLHPDAHDEGGLACTNLELLEAQRRWAHAVDGRTPSVARRSCAPAPLPQACAAPRTLARPGAEACACRAAFPSPCSAVVEVIKSLGKNLLTGAQRRQPRQLAKPPSS